MNVALLFWGFVFSMIGLGFFMYGKRQQVFMPIISGLSLMIFPYFVSGLPVLFVVSLILIALPWVIRF